MSPPSARLQKKSLSYACFFNYESEGDMFLRNVGPFSTDSTTLCARRSSSSVVILLPLFRNIRGVQTYITVQTYLMTVAYCEQANRESVPK
jgi:hypothetical protein